MIKYWLKVSITLIMFLSTTILLILLSFFQSSVGSLIVTTNPTGAEIWLDGKLIAKTPAKLEDVSTGKHKIKLAKQGFYTLEQEIKINEKQTTTLPLFSLQPDKPILTNNLTSNESSPDERIKEFRRLAEGAYLRGDYAFPEKSSAIYFNNIALAINPNDAKSLQLNKLIREALKKQAETAWQKNDFGTSLSAYNQLIENFPIDVTTLAALKRVENKLASRRNLIPHFLRLGENAFNNNRLLSPTSNNAYYYASQVLTIEPNNESALALRFRIKEKLLIEAQDLTSQDDLAGAVKIFQKMLQLFPEDGRIISQIQVLNSQIEQQTNATKQE